jgi:hypothetical protein
MTSQGAVACEVKGREWVTIGRLICVLCAIVCCVVCRSWRRRGSTTAAGDRTDRSSRYHTTPLVAGQTHRLIQELI